MATTIPHENDVLLGRGTAINSHAGNQRFRTLVDSQRQKFREATLKAEKHTIVVNIINEIRSLQPPGRFLMEDHSNDRAGDGTGINKGLNAKCVDNDGTTDVNSNVHPILRSKAWVQVGSEKALDKVYHRLREKEETVNSTPSSPFSPDANESVRDVHSSLREQVGDLSVWSGSRQELAGFEKCNDILSIPSSLDERQNTPIMATIPHRNDVLCGKGTAINCHPGNQRLRSLVEYHKPQFLQVERKHKRRIALDIVKEIKSLHPPGRFLAEDKSGRYTNEKFGTVDERSEIHPTILNKVWVPVSSEKAVVKVMQRMREKSQQGDDSKQQVRDAEWDLLNQERLVQQRLVQMHITSDTSTEACQFDSSSSGPQRESAARMVASILEEQFRDTHVNSDTLSEDLEVIGAESLLQDPSIGYQLFEHTLKQWIVKSQSKFGTGPSSSNYIKAALPVAHKLVDCLIEAERDERNGLGNPIPVASIAADNILIRSKEPHQRVEGSDEVPQETIEYILIMSCVGDSLAAGTIMSRLRAVGIVLFELFSSEEPPLQGPLDSIDLSNEAEPQFNPRKKHQRMTLHAGNDAISKCTSRLQSKGMPVSICDVIQNLLGDSGDDTYSSFADLQLDLQLMLDEPSRFLDDIQTSPLPALEICPKLYGREREVSILNEAYEVYLSTKECSGAIVMGGPGVGKSELVAKTIEQLTKQSDGYYVSAKFDQNQAIFPLLTISSLLNSLCNTFAEDATPSQLESAEKDLERALGAQAGLLAGAVPSVTKLLPSCVGLETASNCVDSAVSMRYLFGELLRIIHAHSSRPISFFLDDIQNADSTSLLLIGNLLFSAKGNVFFTFCYRDNEVKKGGPFEAFLASIEMFSLKEIKLDNMTEESVNKLVSDALHLSPRITRRLSLALHQKTRGSPLFLRQLMMSLKDQGYIYLDMSKPQWSWDLEKIMDVKIADSVLALLVKEMQKLDSDLQLGMKVASCLGARVELLVLRILSKDLDIDLFDILQQVCQKGFMIHCSNSASFRFSHDKVQQAAFEMMPELERQGFQMRLGLALCACALNDNDQDDKLFFSAINLMNSGGPSAVHDPSQKFTIAQLNLKAGNKSVDVADYSSAFQLFKHGIEFLGDDHWHAHYELSLSLFNAAAESASILNRSADVKSYSEQIMANAKCFDDKLNCLYVTAKSLSSMDAIQESMDITFQILTQLGEKNPSDMDRCELKSAMDAMNTLLSSMPDTAIFNMQKTTNKKVVTTLKLYANLVHVLIQSQPALIGFVSLRMVQLTMDCGLSSIAPLAFTYYGEMMMLSGNLSEGCRLGKLALNLLEHKSLLISQTHKPCVFVHVYSVILWTCEPLQSIADSFYQGYKVGKRIGDFQFSTLNLALSMTTNYLAGQSLSTVQKNIRHFLLEMQSQDNRTNTNAATLLYWHTIVLEEGLHVVDGGRRDNIPTEAEVLASTGSRSLISLFAQVYQLMRGFLLGPIEDIPSNVINISNTIEDMKQHLQPVIVVGIFFEGLSCYQLARATTEKEKWINNGNSVLAKMECWSKHSSWNWENKMLLLMAEQMYTLGNFDKAATLYESSMRSSREHKFLHEEAIASELAAFFFRERGLDTKSYSLFMHSIRCYEKWGAHAVAKRVGSYMEGKYGMYYADVRSDVDIIGDIFERGESLTKKRQERG